MTPRSAIFMISMGTRASKEPVFPVLVVLTIFFQALGTFLKIFSDSEQRQAPGQGPREGRIFVII